MNDKALTLTTVCCFAIAKVLSALHWVGAHLADIALCVTILAGLGSFSVSMKKLFGERRARRKWRARHHNPEDET